MAKSALGRGLGELLGEMDEVYDNEVPKNAHVVELSIREVKPNPYQPRTTFDEASLRELSESIKQHGLLQPVVVVEDIDGYVLVAGERRLRASKLAKLKTIRAVIVDITEDQMRQHALIENIQRDQLNALELARAYDELIKVHSITQEELSVMVHKSRTHIANTLRLLQLGAKVQRALAEGKISAGHAKVLVGLDEKTQIMVADSVIGQKLSVRETESMVKGLKNAHNSPAPEAKRPGLDFAQIRAVLGARGYAAKSTANKLTIEFEDADQIASFLKHFS